jgi:RHS repeat-associated protein
VEPCTSSTSEAVAPLQQAIEGSCGNLLTYNKDTGRYDNKCPVGAPINPANGEVYLAHLPDFTLHSEGSEISFFRTYRSYLNDAGALGKGWRSNFEERLIVSTAKAPATTNEPIEYVDETGKSNHFISKEGSSYSASAIPGAALVQLSGNTGYKLDLPEGTSHYFDPQGRLVSIRFASGQALALEYKAGILSSVKDSWGRSIEFKYANDLLRSVVAENGSNSQSLIVFDYDSKKRLTQAKAADGTTETYSYADLEVLGLDHYLATIRDGEGRIIEQHRYNEQGEGIFSSSKEGVFSLAFSDLNHQRKVIVTDETTHRDSVMIYDLAGNQLSRGQDIGIPSARENRFDAQGRVISQSLGQSSGQNSGDSKSGGVHTEISYSGNSPKDFIQKSGNDSRKTHFEYQHPHHLVTEVDYPSVVDPKLTKTLTFKYAGDRVTDQTVHGYTWDLDGKVVSFSDVTHYDYDEAGRLTRIVDPSNRETLFTYYDAESGLDSGRLKSVKRPGEPLVEYSKYDWFGNPLHSIYGGHLAVNTETNVSGKIIGDPSGNTYRYDRSGKITAFIARSGEKKSFKYDNHGELKTTYITSGRGTIEVSIPPESASEKTAEQTHSEFFPADVQTHFDSRGNLIQISRTNGSQTLSGSFSYDLEDHLTGVVWPNGSSSKARYNDRGQIVAEQSEDQKWTRRIFFPDGRLQAEKTPDGKIIESTYDLEGRLVSRGSNTFQYLGESTLVAKMSSSDSSVSYEYDFMGRILSETHQVTANGEAPREWNIHYKRDLTGKIIQTTYPDQYNVGFRSDRISANGESLFQVLKTFHGKPVQYRQGAFSLEEKFNGPRLMERKISAREHLADLSFRYDASDRPTLIEDRFNQQEKKFTYSTQGFLTEQLSTEHGKQISRWSIAYDSLGNPVSLSGPEGKTEVHYSPKSNLPPSHDEAGRVAEKEGWKFNYDAAGILRSAEKGSHRLEFGYDPLGRRTYKIADGKITYFVYDDQNRLLLEETPANQKKLRYVYKGHELIAFQVIQSGKETEYSVLSDQRLAPQWISKTGQSDSQPIRLESSPYDPNAHISASADLHLGTPGQYYDTETGLYYNISRYYDPKTGRYLSSDPTGILGGANPYLYAKANPIVFVDPLGTTPSDSQIITAEDAAECNQQSGGTPIQPNVTTPLNPQLTPLPDEGEVWRVGTNRWNSNYEKLFQQWIATQVNADFLVKFQLKADCADAVSIMRAVFSRIYSLPMLMTNGSRSIGNSTKTWANVPTIPGWNPNNWQNNLLNDQRFRKYITEMTNVVDSQDLILNTYPVKITDDNNTNKLSQYVQPGTVIMNTHHAEFVKEIDTSQFDPLIKMNSTEPAAIRPLWEEPMDIEYPTESGRGFANWDWTVNCGSRGWKHVDASRMPGYDNTHEQDQLNSFDYYSLGTLQQKASENAQEIAMLQKQIATSKGVSNAQVKTWSIDLKQDQQNKTLIAKAETFRQANPNAVVPQSYHDYVQLLAHDGTLPTVTTSNVQADINNILRRMSDRASIVTTGLSGAKKLSKAQADDDYGTTDRDMEDKARFARLVAMLQSQKGKINVSAQDAEKALANQWVDVGNGAKVNALYYNTALLEDANGNLVSALPNATLADRWGCAWIRQKVVPDLNTQLASAQQQLSNAQANLQAYQSAHPSTALSRLEATLSQKMTAVEAAAEAELHMPMTATSSAQNPEQSAYNQAQSQVQSVQNQIQQIQSNYGKIDNCLN